MKRTLIIIILVCISRLGYAGDATISDADVQLQRYHFERAAKIYESVLADKGEDYELLCKLGNAYSIWSSFSEDKKEMHLLCSMALDYAGRAIAANDRGYEGFLLRARAAGQLTDLVGANDKVKLMDVIKRSCNKAIELNPESAEAYMILGMWHSKVSQATGFERHAANVFYGGLPHASLDEAEKYLIRSVTLDEDNIEAYYELARVQLALGKNDDSINSLNKAINCTAISARYKNIKERSKELLKQHS